jgi:hypothetical protein
MNHLFSFWRLLSRGLFSHVSFVLNASQRLSCKPYLLWMFYRLSQNLFTCCVGSLTAVSAVLISGSVLSAMNQCTCLVVFKCLCCPFLFLLLISKPVLAVILLWDQKVCHINILASSANCPPIYCVKNASESTHLFLM